MSCWFGCDQGYWHDYKRRQTLLCPVCKPQQAESQAIARMLLPGWCGAQWLPMPAKYHGPRFQIEPDLLVIHSGSKSDRIAEYFQDPDRVVSAHISWSRLHDDFVQCLPLHTVGWHAGGSRYKGRRRLNFRSIGIELPGPWDKKRDAFELALVRESVACLTNLLPSLKLAVMHSDIDPRKKDPGPGFQWKCLDGLGLEFPFL